MNTVRLPFLKINNELIYFYQMNWAIVIRGIVLKSRFSFIDIYITSVLK